MRQINGLLITFASLIYMVGFGGCSSVSNEQQIVSEWMGREISMPDELVFQIQDSQIDLSSYTPDFRIINFIDSSGCTSCKLKLPVWDKLIKELKAINDVDVEVMTIVDTRNSRDLQYILQRDNFAYPVAIDQAGLFNKENDLPQEAMFNTFLIDKDNNVVAIGNPVINPKIRDLYKKIIINDSGVNPTESDNHDIRLVVEPSQSLGAVDKDTQLSVRYAVINNTDQRYTVQEIVPSCDCISATCDQSELLPGQSAILTLSFATDSITGPFKKYADLFFNEKDTPERVTLFGYVK